MYAIVRAGGWQEKVAVGDTITVDRLAGDTGSAVDLPALLLVDGSAVTSAADALARITVTGEIVGTARGPKIHILRYKNKTGYRRRQGHRSKLTQVRVTAIDGPGITKATAQTKAPKATETTASDKPAATSAGTDAE